MNNHKSREYPESPASPVSNGQGLEEELKGLAKGNACTCAEDRAKTKRFKLARDLCSVEKKIGRKLTTTDVKVASDEWERVSLPFLDWNDDDHFAILLAEVTKVRVTTGEGDTFNKALGAVLKLPDADLPLIPSHLHAPQAMCKLAALHREMSRLCGGKVYFLSYRDAAKVYDELSPSSAHTVTLALEQFGVIKIVCKGKAGLNSRTAAEFRYLLPQSENGAPQTENGCHAYDYRAGSVEGLWKSQCEHAGSECRR